MKIDLHTWYRLRRIAVYFDEIDSIERNKGLRRRGINIVSGKANPPPFEYTSEEFQLCRDFLKLYGELDGMCASEEASTAIESFHPLDRVMAICRESITFQGNEPERRFLWDNELEMSAFVEHCFCVNALQIIVHASTSREMLFPLQAELRLAAEVMRTDNGLSPVLQDADYLFCVGKEYLAALHKGVYGAIFKKLGEIESQNAFPSQSELSRREKTSTTKTNVTRKDFLRELLKKHEHGDARARKRSIREFSVRCFKDSAIKAQLVEFGITHAKSLAQALSREKNGTLSLRGRNNNFSPDEPIPLAVVKKLHSLL